MCGAVKELWQAHIEARAEQRAARREAWYRAHLVTRYRCGSGRGVVAHESAWTQTTTAAAAWLVSRRVRRKHTRHRHSTAAALG